MVCKQEQPEKKMTGFQGGHQWVPQTQDQAPSVRVHNQAAQLGQAPDGGTQGTCTP